jgi:predicted nucleic acid-binding protein
VETLMVHLDTNFLIHFLLGVPENVQRLETWNKAGEPIAVSVIVWMEFVTGPAEPDAIEKAKALIGQNFIPFGLDEATKAAEIFNIAGRQRSARADSMIAATAIIHNAKLATDDPTDFGRFLGAGLKLA